MIHGQAENLMKIAFVHEWLTTYAGSEKVLEVMLGEFPDADAFCLIDYLPDEHRVGSFRRTFRTSYMQKIPFVSKIYRYLLPLMPFSIEQFDLSA